MKNSSRMGCGISRRRFVQTSALTGVALVARWPAMNAIADDAPTTVRTAVDQVTLGNTGVKLSRLGFGTGTDNGQVQLANGKDEFVDLIHYAYDHGITYIDTAESYRTFGVIAEAIKGLPREKLFIQSKMDGAPPKVLDVIDKHRKMFNTDYVDSLLVHCVSNSSWGEVRKRTMDALDQAKEKKWIRAKGVSCHTLPALRLAVAMDWAEVHLVRVNPQGSYTDADSETDIWRAGGRDITPVMEQIKTMHDKGRGVIGMKICGNGTFRDPADGEKSIRHAMACKGIDAIVIGFKSRAEIDEAITRVNNALKEV